MSSQESSSRKRKRPSVAATALKDKHVEEGFDKALVFAARYLKLRASSMREHKESEEIAVALERESANLLAFRLGSFRTNFSEKQPIREYAD